MFKQLSLAVAVALAAGVAQARDTISIVGSSTVFPFSITVAEQFGKATTFGTPKVEALGTGGGFKVFCAGVGAQHPDIANASRAIKDGEMADCKKNGITPVEVLIGFDGLVIANSKEGAPFALTREQVFLALAKQVPNPKGTGLIPNPHQRWNSIGKGLPSSMIEVLGPPPTSGTRDSFVELVMEPGCDAVMKSAGLKLDKKQHAEVCKTLREDGRFIEAGENDNLIVQKLKVTPAAVGIFGYSFFEENRDTIQVANIDGVTPSMDTVADGSYPVSRPLFFYVKKEHVGTIAGLKEFVTEFLSVKASGDEGYLTEHGLVPLPAPQHRETASRVLGRL